MDRNSDQCLCGIRDMDSYKRGTDVYAIDAAAYYYYFI